MVWRAIITMLTSASGAFLMKLSTVKILRSAIPETITFTFKQASLTIARTPLSRTIMVIEKCITHTLSLRSDTCASDGTCAADTFLVPMTTTCLPAKIEPSSTMSARIRSLCTRARKPSSPFARSKPTKELVHTEPSATPLLP